MITEYQVSPATIKICLNSWCYYGKPMYSPRNKDTKAGRSDFGLYPQMASNTNQSSLKVSLFKCTRALSWGLNDNEGE